jgi:heterotetrameric sarcosine oxidase gamma subunit
MTTPPPLPAERLANRELATDVLEPLDAPPERARVVIVGGGIIGSSIAYHLTKLGVDDVVVLERGRLTNGTTWHAAGLVSRVRGSHALTALSAMNAATYERLPAETGIETGLRRCGALTVARTEAHLTESLYGVSVARDFDIPVEVLDGPNIKSLWPNARVDDLIGGVLFPTDGTVNPGDAALAFAKGAKDGGARFVQGATVTDFRFNGGRCAGVVTDRGAIEAETVVLAAGLWTSELARMAGASVALYPAEHVWVMTEPAEGADGRAPFLRDLDGYLYIRHYQGRYLVGAFEPNGKPKRPADIPTDGFVEFGPDWDHFAPVLANARQRLPELESIGFSHFLRAPESFTPDVNFHLGEFPEVPGLFVAAGLNSQGIIFGPGVGTALSEWIVAGHPTMDLAEVDVARTGRWANQRNWLHERTVESLGRLYAMHWPGLTSNAGRGVRRLPLHDRLRAAGAAFGEAGGWDRPAWYEPGVLDPDWGYSFERPSWLAPMNEEVRAAREGVALFDLTSYAKFLVQGTAALEGLQHLCTGDLDVAQGRVTYTLLCNARGGIEMDPTVTRLEQDRFLVVAPTLAQRRTQGLLRNGLPAGATVTDVTSAWATLHVAGPRSRELLTRLSDADLSNAAFPFLSGREIDVAWARAWALRVSYTGELGWELYVPTEFVSDLYDRLVAAGEDLGLRHGGGFAFDALRIERGFRGWGHDMGPRDDPFAAGLGFAVRAGKEHVGAQALAELREQPRTRRMVSIKLAAPEPLLWHGESVLIGGRRAGEVTSAAFGATLGAPVGLAWIHADGPVTQEILESVQIEVRGDPVPAIASIRPFHDPGGARLRT